MQNKSQEGSVYRIHLKELSIAELQCSEMSLSYKKLLERIEWYLIVRDFTILRIKS